MEQLLKLMKYKNTIILLLIIQLVTINSYAQEWSVGIKTGLTGNLSRQTTSEILKPTIGLGINSNLHKRIDIEADINYFNTGKSERAWGFHGPNYETIASHDKFHCLRLSLIGKYNFISKSKLKVYSILGITSQSHYNKFYQNYETPTTLPINIPKGKIVINGTNHVILGVGTAISLSNRIQLDIQPNISTPINPKSLSIISLESIPYLYCLHLQTGVRWKLKP